MDEAITLPRLLSSTQRRPDDDKTAAVGLSFAKIEKVDGGSKEMSERQPF
jgi:hypothetical protein